MIKTFCATFLIFANQIAFSQVNPITDVREVKMTEQLKLELRSKAGLSSTATDKIAAIEAEFLRSLSAINEQKNLLTKEREKKLNEAHVTRRSKLSEVPLTARQMEDVILLSESIQRKIR